MGGSHELNLISVSLVCSSHCTADRCSQVPISRLKQHSDGVRGGEAHTRERWRERCEEEQWWERQEIMANWQIASGRYMSEKDRDGEKKDSSSFEYFKIFAHLRQETICVTPPNNIQDIYLFICISGSTLDHMISIFFSRYLCQRLQHLLSSD